VDSGLDSRTASIRSHWLPGDFGQIIVAHSQIVGAECGFDETFEHYVASGLLEFVKDPNQANRFWLVTGENLVKGSIFLHLRSARVGQIRWFWLDPELRGRGLGRRLLHLLIDEARHQNLTGLYLWTVAGLAESAHLYREAGFSVSRSESKRLWGRDLIEQRLELELDARESNESA